VDQERVLWELAQRRCIEEVLLDYCEAVDLNDVDRLVDEVFTPDARFELGSRHATEGSEALRDMFARTLAQFEASSHHLSNVRITVTGEDSAEASAYVYAWHSFRPDSRRVDVWGRYHDQLRLVDDRWRLAVRRLTVAGSEWPGVAFESIPRKP
jgi:ketosteroid isomerase-like protein